MGRPRSESRSRFARSERAALIVQAAEEVAEGKLDDHFPLDIFDWFRHEHQTNANEVIANRCAQLAGKTIGSRELVHPTITSYGPIEQRRDSFRDSTSSAAEQLKNCLIPRWKSCTARSMRRRRNSGHHQDRPDPFDGRDADPAGTGIFRYAQQGWLCRKNARKIDRGFARAGAGWNAVGTGLNRHVDLPGKVLRHLEQRTSIAFLEAKEPF